MSYVGAHKTNNIDDGYFGSGLALKKAIRKYGKENFSKEILFDFSSESEMWDKEREIVNEGFISKRDNYNISLGGYGGWDYAQKVHPRKSSEKYNDMLSKWTRFVGMKHSEESKAKIGKKMKGKYDGSSNPNYGNHWVTDGVNNKLVKKDVIPDGWRKGRV